MQRRLLFIIVLALTLAACTDDGLDGLTVEQRDLIGRAVNFNATRVDAFTTRTTYDDTGAFNEDDLMRIYRQYDKGGGTWGDEAYRTYIHNTKYAPGTTISLGKDWRVYVGRTGHNTVDDALHDAGDFLQSEQDSITWDHGGTVRFRSWTRSNYTDALKGCYKWYGADGLTNYYPDFCVSDWVTVSGPTAQIPLNMRHICSRIVFSRRNDGNEFHHVEVDTIWEDYKRIDNSDLIKNDDATNEAGKRDDDAKAECNQVLAAYCRMCMPSGVDIEQGALHAMMKTYWNNLYNGDEEAGNSYITSNRSARNSRDSLPRLEENATTNFYHFGTRDADYIRHYVQRPVFANVNGSCYLLTIPYDMSNGTTQGDIITLPACTRFRVYLRDVNNGDGNHTDGYEGTYHIFSLQDIVGSDGKPMYPDGLDMLPGRSYRFRVGYRYNKLTITADDHFSWDEQDREADNLNADIHAVPTPTTADYSWWRDTIANAIPTSTGGDFNPVFHIKTQQQFIEFINLVNGTAAQKTSGLTRVRRKDVNPDHAGNSYDEHNWWYSEVSANKRDTTWVTSAEATAMGYLLYQSYHAANANQPAYSEEEYIREPYPFYDETRNRHYTVYLDNDLDLCDWELPSIGGGWFYDPKKTTYRDTPFMGYFDGKNHTLRNLNMREEYLFKYIESAAIRNLRIESTHKVSLVKEGTNTNYIVGIDLRAHSTKNSIAESLTSNTYNNPSYVVGCIHVGDAGGALVGASDNLYMYGCMQAAEGIPSGQGALLGKYLTQPHDNKQFFAPRISFDYSNMSQQLKGTPSWGRFSCNYYDTELSKRTNAVGTIGDLYSPLEYIRGRESFVLKAKNDNTLKGDASFNALSSIYQRMAYYGLAPWRAMNYGILRYNQTTIGGTHKCNAHYENDSTGYIHRYPELKAGVPVAGQYANPLEQNN